MPTSLFIFKPSPAFIFKDKASYFRNVQVVDSSNNLKALKGLGIFTEQPNCYDVQTGSNGDWGYYFYFGGPGRNPNCP
ncbi:unnamed protein product [Coffea canephora]|uniref:Neprosin PEP catalytic domain-containing protein n=1 Tax=Coffea canephora TaxID=49390 RepID=A0A068UW71_COFCA|nr:unnamed protein product [Coffea canephora]